MRSTVAFRSERETSFFHLPLDPAILHPLCVQRDSDRFAPFGLAESSSGGSELVAKWCAGAALLLRRGYGGQPKVKATKLLAATHMETTGLPGVEREKLVSATGAGMACSSLRVKCFATERTRR